MTIQTIIDKFDKEFVVTELWGEQEMKFVNNPTPEQLKQFLEDSLTSMLDGIEKESKDLDCYTQTTLSSGKKVNLVSKEEVINIINSHR